MFDIPWYYKAAIVAVIAGLLYGGFSWWKADIISKADAVGYARANAEWAVKEADIKDQAENKMAQGIAKAKADTVELQKKFDVLSVTNFKQKEDYENRLANHVASALANRERLSIVTLAASACSVPHAPASGDTGAASEPPGETRSDVVPAVAARIFSIAGDSAGLVRDFNELHDRYEAARATCNAP